MGVYKRKESGKYCIRYTFKGRRIRETIGTSKKEAELVWAMRKSEINQNKFHYFDKENKIGFPEFAQMYYELYSKNNKKSYKRDLLNIKILSRFFGDTHLVDITPLLIEQYKTHRLESVSKATTNRELACLKHMFTMAIKWGYANINPVKAVRLFREPKYDFRILTKEEEKGLLDVSPLLLKSIIITALNTGMRKTEILRLTWDKVDFIRNNILVTQTKNDESRFIPMNPYLKNTLLSLGRVSNYVFTYPNGEPVLSLKGSFYTALKKAGIRGLRFHDLRHTFASRLVMKGMDLVTVKELLGHKSIVMTMRYSHPSDTHKRMAVDLLNIDIEGKERPQNSHRTVSQREVDKEIVLSNLLLDNR